MLLSRFSAELPLALCISSLVNAPAFLFLEPSSLNQICWKVRTRLFEVDLGVCYYKAVECFTTCVFYGVHLHGVAVVAGRLFRYCRRQVELHSWLPSNVEGALRRTSASRSRKLECFPKDLYSKPLSTDVFSDSAKMPICLCGLSRESWCCLWYQNHSEQMW